MQKCIYKMQKKKTNDDFDSTRCIKSCSRPNSTISENTWGHRPLTLQKMKLYFNKKKSHIEILNREWLINNRKCDYIFRKILSSNDCSLNL